MEVKAKLSNLRMSPRKVRLVCDIVRGMDTTQAKEQLKFINKKAAQPIAKLLDSAIANAANNFKLNKDNLYIKTVNVNEGRKLKRYQPRAMGRATMILKRSSIIDLVLAEKVESKRVEKAKKSARGQAEPKGAAPSVKRDPAEVRRRKIEKEDLKVVSPEEIKKDWGGGKKSEQENIQAEKKPMLKLKEIKDKFTRRTGER